MRRVPSAYAPDGPLELEHASFVAACFELSTIYDRLGAFLGPAKKDMVGNLAVIQAGIASRNSAAAAAAGGGGGPVILTVQDAARYDMRHSLCYHQTKDRKGISFGILWLIRALRFIDILLDNLDQLNPRFGLGQGFLESKHCAADAYARSIKPYHGRFLTTVFGAMMGQIPARRALLAELHRPAAPTTPPKGWQGSPKGSGKGSPKAQALEQKRRGGSVSSGVSSAKKFGKYLSSRASALAPSSAPAAGDAVDEAAVYREMASFRALLGPMVDSLHEFFVAHGLNDPWKA